MTRTVLVSSWLVLTFMCAVHCDTAIDASLFNNLSIKFFRAVNKTCDNFVYSPMSMSTALAMLWEGATGETRNELTKLLGKDAADADVAITPSFKAVIEKYATFNSDKLCLKTANMAMVAKSLTLKESYKTKLTSDYKALVSGEDFANDGPAVTEKVNNFVKQNTNNLIDKIIDEIDGGTRFMLVNTLAFEGKWLDPFVAWANENATFYGTKNSTTVTYMTSTRAWPAANVTSKKMRLVELPYHGNVSMFVFLPDERNGLTSMVDGLTAGDIDTHIEAVANRRVELKMPKFAYAAEYDLNPILKDMGLTTPFGPNSLLTNIVDGASVSISKSIHKAVIDVNEEGTRAAAVTAIMTDGSALEPNPPEPFNMDHPFMYVIRDKSTGINLFMGMVNDIAAI